MVYNPNRLLEKHARKYFCQSIPTALQRLLFFFNIPKHYAKIYPNVYNFAYGTIAKVAKIKLYLAISQTITYKCHTKSFPK